MIIPRRSINDGRQRRVSMSGAVKLTVELASQLLGIGIGEQSRQAEPGVVDQDVEPAESSRWSRRPGARAWPGRRGRPRS